MKFKLLVVAVIVGLFASSTSYASHATEIIGKCKIQMATSNAAWEKNFAHKDVTIDELINRLAPYYAQAAGSDIDSTKNAMHNEYLDGVRKIWKLALAAVNPKYFPNMTRTDAIFKFMGFGKACRQAFLLYNGEN